MARVRWWYLVIFALLAPTPARLDAQAQSRSVRGLVLDGVTRRPVTGAEIWLDDGRARVSTGADGRFSIGAVPPGLHTVHVSRIGYEDLDVEDVLVEQDGPTLELVLVPAAIPLAELVVSPGAFTFMGRSPSTRQTMSRSDIESVPQFAEDIFRAVNRLPGLSSGDYSAHFSVRGGRHDETLILLDGLEIYEPYHLKDFNDGAISIIDVETIDGVDLMTGGFPAKYGNRTSGVFSVTTRDPEAGRARTSVGISLVNARAMAEGVFDEGRGGWFVSGRRGYLDLVLSLLNQNDVPSPSYHDVFGKVTYRLTPNHTVALNVLESGDAYTFSALATTGFQDSIDTEERADNHYGNRYAWLTLRSLLGRRATVRTIASAGSITSDRAGTEFYRSNGLAIYALTGTRDFSVLGLKQDWRVDLTDWSTFEFGVDARRHDANYSFLNVVNQDPDYAVPDTTGFYPHEDRSATTRSGTTLGAYLAARVRLARPLTVEVGGRYDRASYTGDRDLSPRVNALVSISDATSVRFGFGHFRQMQGIGDVSLLDPMLRYYPSELSRQWTAGFEHVFGDGGLLRIEAYRKSGSSLRPVYRNWKGGLDVFPETNEDRILVSPERTLSRGIELYHQRNLGDRLSVRGSYALAAVDETAAVENVNDPFALDFDPIHGGPQDQRHAVNLDATYRVSESWSVNASYAFHTGWPGTLEQLLDVTDPGTGATESVVRPMTVYGHRLPNYSRIDARLTKRSRRWGGDFRFFFEVSNLTNHQNVFGYDYFRAPGAGGVTLERDSETGFTILPSLGVSWTR